MNRPLLFRKHLTLGGSFLILYPDFFFKLKKKLNDSKGNRFANNNDEAGYVCCFVSFGC